MFDYLTKNSIINLKEFIVETINYLGWELDFSTRPPRFFKYCLEVSMNANCSDGDLVKRQYIQ